jgi:hypothetical protein
VMNSRHSPSVVACLCMDLAIGAVLVPFFF